MINHSRRTYLLVFSLFLAACFLLQAQNPVPQLSTVNQFKKNKIVRVNEQDVNEANFFREFESKLGINDFHKFENIKTLNDHKSGFQHIKFQQSYKDLDVIGAHYTLHKKANRIQKATGYLFPFINHDCQPRLVSSEAFVSAKENMNSKYQGEIIEGANWVEEFSQLCLIDENFPSFSGKIKLAYEVIISAEGKSHPFRHKVYIDAETGNLICNFSEVTHEAVPARVQTLRYGEQMLVTDSVAPDKYLLHDPGRGVVVLNANTDKDTFVDADNYWNNFNNDIDEVAGDAHYCATQLHDMMESYFNWKGLDGEGGEYVSVVHARGRYYNNAYWDGRNTNFGNGDCERYHPFTLLDVVGHEFAHGFTDFTSDLVYAYEPGALNESLSDIFGKALEHYATPDDFNWFIGDKLRRTEDVKIIRSMSNPNDRNNPKYYGGDHWLYGESDRGGVHTNSGVLNYWFYLLVEGISDVNEKGESFSVEKLGWTKALDIVFSMQVGYLTMTSRYPDAMYASLEVCRDLYGIDSEEEKAVLEAWRAVGLFPGIDYLDLQVELGKDFIALCPEVEEEVTVYIVNTGVIEFPGDTTINIFFLQHDTDQIDESVFIDAPIAVGDSLEYTFNTSIRNDPEFNGEYSILLDKTDLNPANNVAYGRIVAAEFDGLDISLEKFEFVTASECGSETLERFNYGLRNLGCKIIPEDDTVYFDIVSNVGDFTLPRKIFSDNEPGDYQGGGAIFGDVIVPEGISSFSATFRYPGEIDNGNNELNDIVTFNSFIESGYVEYFDENYNPNKFSIDTYDVYATDTIVNYFGNEMLAISGRIEHDNFDYCTDAEGFFEEFNVATEIEYCADTRNMVEPIFEFDMIQFLNMERQTVLPEDNYGVMVQVQLENENFPIIYGLENGILENYQFPLQPEYQGDVIIRIVTASGHEDSTIDFFENKDAVLLDNVRLFDLTTEVSNYNDEGFLAYPNPASFSINVLRDDRLKRFDVKMYSDIGELVWNKKELVFQESIDVSDFSSGVYFLQFLEEGEVVSYQKVVILK